MRKKKIIKKGRIVLMYHKIFLTKVKLKHNETLLG